MTSHVMKKYGMWVINPVTTNDEYSLRLINYQNHR